MASSSTPLRAPHLDEIDEETGLPMSELRAHIQKGLDDIERGNVIDGEEADREFRDMFFAKYGMSPEEMVARADGKA
jgi:hypothetical protein